MTNFKKVSDLTQPHELPELPTEAVTYPVIQPTTRIDFMGETGQTQLDRCPNCEHTCSGNGTKYAPWCLAGCKCEHDWHKPVAESVAAPQTQLDNGPNVCKRCNAMMSTHDGDDPTDYCDHCAQELCAQPRPEPPNWVSELFLAAAEAHGYLAATAKGAKGDVKGLGAGTIAAKLRSALDASYVAPQPLSAPSEPSDEDAVRFLLKVGQYAPRLQVKFLKNFVVKWRVAAEPLSATPEPSNKAIDWSKSMWCATGHHGNCQGSNRLWWECKCECHAPLSATAQPPANYPDRAQFLLWKEACDYCRIDGRPIYGQEKWTHVDNDGVCSDCLAGPVFESGRIFGAASPSLAEEAQKDNL